MTAYIVFLDKESAEAATASNQTEFMGHHLRVDLAASSGKFDPKKSVFVGNLPFDATEEQVIEFFSECGSVQAVRIVRDKSTSIGKGFCYVLFANRSDVSLAITKNGSKLGKRVGKGKGVLARDGEQVTKRMVAKSTTTHIFSRAVALAFGNCCVNVIMLAQTLSIASPTSNLCAHSFSGHQNLRITHVTDSERLKEVKVTCVWGLLFSWCCLSLGGSSLSSPFSFFFLPNKETHGHGRWGCSAVAAQARRQGQQ
eukprot:m.164072 g.164072  ORF g.164072 m.164072 type:complete len:255 (+) comp17705_c0_seq3:1220-1984(+)